MSVSTGRHNAATIEIDGKPYFLQKDEAGVPQWHPVAVPTEEGDPSRPRQWRWRDWSKGMGDSRGVFPGAVEYALAYLGVSMRILPPPAITTVETNHDAPIVAITPVTAPANRIITHGGRYSVEVNPAAHTVAATEDHGGGKVITDAALMYDQLAIAFGIAARFKRRSAAGAYSDNTLVDANLQNAQCFGIAGDGSLVRGWGAYWSRCAATDFYGTDGNWTGLYQIGDLSGAIQKVFGHQRWDYVLKDEGLYTFDEENSDETNVLTDLASFKSTENRNWFAWHDQLFICSLAGLYRYIAQGAARTVGIEECELNEGELLNVYPTAGEAFGRWAYVAYYRPANTTTYLCLVRRAQEGDTGMGSPYTVVSVLDTFTGYCRAIKASALSGTPRLYYGDGSGDLRFFELTRDGTPASYKSSSTAVVRFAPTDLGNPMTLKFFRSIKTIQRGLTGGASLQWSAALDGGNAANVGSSLTGATGAPVEAFWTAGTSDSARVIQLTATLTLASAGTPAQIRDVELNFEERPLVVPGAVFSLRLRDFDSEGDVSTRATAKEQKAAILALLGPNKIVTVRDPEGETYQAALSPYEGRAAYSYRGEMPAQNLNLVLRKLTYS